MAYSQQPTYVQFGLFDFGGGADETFSIILPKGRGSRLYDYGVFGIIEAMNGDTLDPQMSVGTPSDADAYGEEWMITTALGPDNHAASVRSTFQEYDRTNLALYLVDKSIDPDAEIVLKCLAA